MEPKERDVLASRRVWAAVIGMAFVWLFNFFDFGLEPEQIERITNATIVFGTAYIGGVSLEDFGRQLSAWAMNFLAERLKH